jgi:hypothetical protein
VVDEFLVKLVRLDREICLTALLVAIDVEEPFVVLAFLYDVGKADCLALCPGAA